MWSFFKSDPSKDFPFELGELIKGLDEKSIWTLYKGKKKNSNVEVSMFEVKNGSDLQMDIARSGIKRLKQLRHPTILTFLDNYESEKHLLMATEYGEPLLKHLQMLALEGAQRDLYLSWGIFQITRALSFLINDGNLRHNNVNVWSVFVTASGEWKLGGVEYVGGIQDSLFPIKIMPGLEIYDPPEKSSGINNQVTKCSSDMWGLGCLIWEVFNGSLKQQSSLKRVENIPKQLVPLYCELVGANATSRPNPADIITRCRKVDGYFKNDLVDTLLFLEEIQIKDKNEKNRFFSNLTPHLDNFPDVVCTQKILPQLINAFEYGDAGSAVLAPMFKLGKLLEEGEYQKKIVPCVVKLFSSNDRATRSRLLQQLEFFIGHLQSGTVNEQIFPQIAHGFMDTNPTIREQTVKSVIHLASKLNYNNLNVEVLRHFARLQSKDDQGGIRTNTTVCLGKIAQHLHPQIRQKVLISAFVRAMRDPFPPARNAGILALAATQQYYLLTEVAARILPVLCQLTMDPEKFVRDSAFRTIKGFLGKLEKVSEDPSLRESMEADVNTATPSLSNAAATWAGWAVTAVTAKFYRSQSDTVKSINPMSSKMLTKPGSLEQPSSSSISTTTSSVTSMTSLEEASRGNDSVSDYDCDQWGDENWGDMETGGQMASSSASGGASGASGGTTGGATSEALSPPESVSNVNTSSKITDGWDNEEWASLEEETALTSPSDPWSLTEALANEQAASTTNAAAAAHHTIDEIVPLTPLNRLEEAKKKREERKMMRQMEMEARRASRSTLTTLGGGAAAGGGGPMKLGVKKI